MLDDRGRPGVQFDKRQHTVRVARQCRPGPVAGRVIAVGGLSMSNTAVFLGIVVSACIILAFLGGCIGFAFKVMRKLAIIEELPGAVKDVSGKLQAIADSNDRWHGDHLRYDHSSGRMRRRD